MSDELATHNVRELQRDLARLFIHIDRQERRLDRMESDIVKVRLSIAFSASPDLLSKNTNVDLVEENDCNGQ